MTLTLEVEGLDRLIATANDPALVTKPMSHVIAKATAVAERAAKERAGRSVAATIQSEVKPLEGKIRTTHPGAHAIEGGRRPGAAFPPSGPIEKWRAEKGIAAEPFVLARAIARRGTKGRFFMKKAKGAVRKALPGLLSEAADEMNRRWVK